MYKRGNGYEEHERGRFEAALVWEGVEIAHTSGDLVIADSRYYWEHSEEVTAWANEYDLEIEWK